MGKFNIAWGTVTPKKHLKGAHWQRTAGIDDAGQVWAPAAIAGNEKTVFLCAAFDNEPGVFREHHLYLRTSWLRREFSDTAETLDVIEAKIKGIER